MAGLDRMYDAQADIQGYIEKKTRDLLEEDMNELQDPNWVQAATLFNYVVIPCETYIRSYLYDLAEDIVNKAEQHHNRVVYQNISPRLYNQRVINPNLIDQENLPDDIQIVSYKDTINRLKDWMDRFKKEWGYIYTLLV